MKKRYALYLGTDRKVNFLYEIRMKFVEIILTLIARKDISVVSNITNRGAILIPNGGLVQGSKFCSGFTCYKCKEFAFCGLSRSLDECVRDRASLNVMINQLRKSRKFVKKERKQ